MLIQERRGAEVVARDDPSVRARRISAEAWLVGGVTIVGAVLRFATITHQSLWFDEAQAVHEMHLSLAAMLSAWSANEPNPPLYFVLAWPWAQLFGAGEAGLRSLSALLGTITIPVVYLCGRELVSRRAGLFAAAFAAVNPFLIWYSQEAREYMLLTVLSAASVLFFARAWRTPSRRNLAWWAVFSGLALLTQYFAIFLVAAEALTLLYRARSRACLIAVGAMVLVEALLIPHLVGHVAHPAGWIDQFPLSVRIEQVPVAFGFSTLYLGPAVSYGLIGAAVLAGALIALLVAGAGSAELRGAGVAAGLAGAVILTPLVLALIGHDYYEARALIPGWIPLAVVVGAACAAARARAAGAVLALILCAGFLYAGVKIDGNSLYQRQNWRGVAAVLGPTHATRAIVAYDGQFAAVPLAIYLPGVPWTGPAQTPQVSEAPVTVSELDIVGDEGQRIAARLPAGIRLISSRRVDSYLVDRFALSRPLHLAPGAIGAKASAILGPAPIGPTVLIQRASA
jgi:4-amino-4-deoxy-L-arabinose transferase-like glycosyltransferase